MERLYDDLAWLWPLLSPHEQYRKDAQLYAAWLRNAAGGRVASVLELGCGGGHVSHHLPREWALTLVDRAPGMLDVSRRLNPHAEHVEADFTTMRLGRTFDAVLLHDAVMYCASREALAAAFQTAAAHLRPGGGFVVLPDVVKEDFVEMSTGGGAAEGSQAARLLEWHWDPDPSDDTYQIDMAILYRDGAEMKAAHDRHTLGLYPRNLYVKLLREAGFTPIPPEPWDTRDAGAVFLATRTGADAAPG
jgi:SAM-dependent methyltransferase